MKPERIENLLREPPPTEPSFARPMPPLPSGVAQRRIAFGGSVMATSGATATLVALVIVGLIAFRFGEATPGPSPTAAANSSSSAPSSSPAADVIPWIDTRFVLPSVAPTEPVTDYPLCPAAQMALLAGGWSGATGSAAGGIDLINLSANPCRIATPTSIILRDADGAEIARSTDQRASSVVAVPSGGTASATLIWANWCQPTAPKLPLQVAITLTLDGETSPQITTLQSDVIATMDGSAKPRCDAPSSTPTVGLVDFRWEDRELGDYQRKPCTSADVRAFDNGWGAAAGTWYSQVVVYNASSFDCDLPEPVVDIRDGDGRAILNGRGPTGSGLGLPSGGTATLELELADWCMPPPKMPVSLDLRVASDILGVALPSGPDGGFPFDSCMAAPATPPPTFDIGSFAKPTFDIPEPPSDPGDHFGPYLSASVSLPPSVRPGQVLDYTVTLTNRDPYEKPYNLAGLCPSYTEKLIPLGSAATVTERYQLNCDPVGVLEGGHSATFAMRLIVPSDSPLGEGTVIWQLGQVGAAAKSGIWIGDPTSAPSPQLSSMSVDLSGAMAATSATTPLTCDVDPTGQLQVMPEPVRLAQGGFARIAIYAPDVAGGYAAEKLTGPDGGPGVAVTVVDNPAGGAGGPTWKPWGGNVVVNIETTSSGEVIEGSVEAKLSFWKDTEGATPPPDVHDAVLTARWRCPIDGAPQTTPISADAECIADQLRADASRQGENGVDNIEVGLTNIGSSDCWLPNVPNAIGLVRADGKPLPLAVRPAVGAPGANVRLRSGTTPAASVIGYWGNWCDGSPEPLDVVVTFDNPTIRISAPLSGSLLPRCDYQGQSSWIQIDSLVGS